MSKLTDTDHSEWQRYVHVHVYLFEVPRHKTPSTTKTHKPNDIRLWVIEKLAIIILTCLGRDHFGDDI